jgi:hypothetical protein
MSECCSTNACTVETASGAECPSCGETGTRLDPMTLGALLLPEALGRGVPASPRFCANVACRVVYFDNEAEIVFDERELTVPVHAKHPGEEDVPVCYCFGHTSRSIREGQARDGFRSVSTAITLDIRAGLCACEVKNPKGSCCLGDVVRVERAMEAPSRVREETTS